MNCAKCGTELQPGGSFCSKCGQQVAQSPTTGQKLTDAPVPSRAGDANIVKESEGSWYSALFVVFVAIVIAIALAWVVVRQFNSTSAATSPASTPAIATLTSVPVRIAVTSAPVVTLTSMPTSEPTATPTSEPTATPTATPVVAVVQAASANLRDGPGASYEVIGTFRNGDRVAVVGRVEDSSWYKIQLVKGVEGWVSSALLKLPVASNQIVLAPTPTASPTPDQRAAQTVTAKAKATATIEAYRKSAPKGAWCDDTGMVCVYDFRYFRSSSLYNAGSGGKFVGFGIQVENNGESTIHVNPTNVTLIDFEGRTYSYDVVTFDYFETPLQAVNVLPGNKASGGIAFKIPANSAPARVVYEVGLLGPMVEIDLKRSPDQQ